MIKKIPQIPRRIIGILLILSITFVSTPVFVIGTESIVSANTAVSQSTEILDQAIKNTKSYFITTVKNPTIGSVAGDWVVCGLARSEEGVTENYFNTYYQNTVNFLKENKGELSSYKYTEYSRLILALTAIGKDITNVGGYNLLYKLADFDFVIKQGINGPIYALIALDSRNYQIPQTDPGIRHTTRPLLVDYIISRELPGGGFALGGKEADPDITAMAVQALANYKDQPAVANCIERAMKVLSIMQGEQGGIVNQGVESSESTAQVIAALSVLGIDLQTDRRFIKTDNTGKENNLLTALLNYQMKDGSFRHIIGGSSDQMASEQAFLALVAYNRLLKEKEALFDMADVSVSKGENPGAFYQYKVLLNGNYLVFDQPPVNINRRVLVPMRGIFEALGADIQWDGTLKKVTGILGNRKVILTIGQPLAYMNGQAILLDTPGFIVNQRTMVPIRFIAESLDAQVNWDGNTNKVIITK